MKRYAVLLTIALLFCKINARTETYYYNENFKGVDDAPFAEYTLAMSIPEDSAFERLFRMTHKSGTIVFEGIYETIDKYNFYNSKLVSYKCYDNKGTLIEKKINTGNNSFNLERYFSDGKVQTILPYVNEQINGDVIENIPFGGFIKHTYVKNLPNDYFNYTNEGQVLTYKCLGEDKFTLQTEPVDIGMREVLFENVTSMYVYRKNGLVIKNHVGRNNAYGDYVEVFFEISNIGLLPIELDPQSVEVIHIKKSIEEKQVILSLDEFINKVENKQSNRNGWKELGLSLLAGLSSNKTAYFYGSANTYGWSSPFSYYGTTSFSGSVSYTDYEELRKKQEEIDEYMDERKSVQAEEREDISKGYLQKTNLNPGQTLKCFVVYKYKKSDNVEVYFSIDGVPYNFSWCIQ